MRGIEIDGFAVSLARVTLWMGHKLAVDELDLTEATLPLADLSGIQVVRRAARRMAAGGCDHWQSAISRCAQPSTCVRR